MYPDWIYGRLRELGSRMIAIKVIQRRGYCRIDGEGSIHAAGI